MGCHCYYLEMSFPRWRLCSVRRITQWLLLLSSYQDHGKCWGEGIPFAFTQSSVSWSSWRKRLKNCGDFSKTVASKRFSLSIPHSESSKFLKIPTLMFLLACGIWWFLFQFSKYQVLCLLKAPIFSDVRVVVCLRPQFSEGSNKSCQYSVHLAFLMTRMECWHLSSLHVQLKPEAQQSHAGVSVSAVQLWGSRREGGHKWKAISCKSEQPSSLVRSKGFKKG